MFIESRDGTDAVVGQCAEDLNNSLLVSAYPRDGVVELLSVEVGEGRHQGDDHILQVATQLALQLTD